MPPLLPKFRSDLKFREHASPEGRVSVVKDPSSGEYFRFQEVELFIAQQLDGETPFETVRSRVEEKFDATFEPETLTDFVKTLDRNGLLEQDGVSNSRRGAPPRVNGDFLHFRIRLFDPSRLFNAVDRRIGFFFTTHFVVLSACLIGAAVGVTAFNWNDVVEQASGLYNLSTLPLLVVTIFLILTAHEFAHGLTCKHFGGEVREIGFLLMYLQPAFYCNVSDAWLFPEKSKRLWVGFAGPYFELFLWALATLAWRLTDPGTWINQISLVAMGTSGILTLLNFNPLIKLDGYYLLSDWLDIPNLRKKSFRYLGDSLRTLGGLVGEMPAVSRRERRIFLTYGATAWAFSVSLLIYSMMVIGEFLIIEKQRVAFFAFTALASLRLRISFRKLFRQSSKGSKSSHSSSRAFDRLRWAFVTLAVLAIVVALLFLARIEFSPRDFVAALIFNNADAHAETAAVVSQNQVDEGERVQSQEVLALPLDPPVQAEPKKKDSRIAESGARHTALEAGLPPEVMRLAETLADGFQEQLRSVRDWMERSQRQYEQDLTSLRVNSVMVLGEILMLEPHRFALLAFVGFTTLRLRVSFRRRFRRSSDPSKVPVRSKRTYLRFGPSFVKIAVVAVVVTLLYVVRIELRVAGPVTALPHHNADVRAEVSGIVAQICVEEGQRVQTGDLIALLLDRDVQAELQKTQARIEENGARLKLLEAGTRPEEIQLAQYVVTRAQEQLKFAEDRMERNRRLYEEQLVSLNEHEESARLVAAASADLVEAKKKLSVLQAGSRPEEIEAMKAMVSSLETQKSQLERQLELMRVLSPASGVVTTPARQLKTMEHRFVDKGDLIAKVHDLEVITAEIALSEKEIADVHVGLNVALKVRAYPERLFHGRVVKIATAAQGAAIETSIDASSADVSADAKKSANTIVVTTEIENSAGMLKPGMTGMAKIYCGERRLIDLITRRISRTFRVEFWSWW